MKKKRVLLHICILVLSLISMGCLGYVGYWESQNSRDDYKAIYAHEYRGVVAELMEYAHAQSVYHDKYSNMENILVKNKELGNVTVKDIVRIYREYDYWDDDYTVYELREEAEARRYEYPTADNKNEYDYYNEVCAALEEYAECLQAFPPYQYNSNREEIDENRPLEFGRTAHLESDLSPEFCYHIIYKRGDKEYTISNVEDAGVLNEGNGYTDINVFENGKFVVQDDTYATKDLNELIVSGWTDFYDSVTKMVFAIDDNYFEYSDNTYYNIIHDASYSDDCMFLELIKKMGTAPSQQQLVSVRKSEVLCICAAVGVVVIAGILFLVLMVTAGHRQKGDVAQLFSVDKLWIDVCLATAVVIYTCWLAVVWDKIFEENHLYRLFTGIMVVWGVTAVELILQLSESFVRRVKTKNLLKTTLTGKLWWAAKRIAGKAKKSVAKLLDHTALTIKIVIFGIIWIICNCIQIMFIEYNSGGLEVLILIGAPAVGVCYIIWKYFSENEIIKQGAEKISGGDIDFKIEEEMKFRSNKMLRDSFNNIGEGLSVAVEESIKNEKMKSELITNVSHDLKTPLTSIINYVDLLKTDGIDSEQAKKYLQVLDQKSQRLKNLTEDLVEVSKLSSGVAELKREKLDIVQLLNQSLAEYDEKFGQKGLQIIKTIQEQPLYVMADGRKTWRLFDNLYNNIFKYAMNGTRVYIDVKVQREKVVVSVKNISENPLNFSADELMERFVRGDVSRTTEGSGLGLSIARSIAERQDGEMNITLDGDLFKVEVMMNLI